MAKSVIWSEEALHDIDLIAEYISRDSVYYAQQVVERIIKTGESVNLYPRSGTMVPELGEACYREKFVYSYRLIYEIGSNTVNILAVIHGKRLLEPDGRFADD